MNYISRTHNALFFLIRTEVVYLSFASISKLSVNIYILMIFAVLKVEEILEKLII
jgi:hypothetical protein